MSTQSSSQSSTPPTSRPPIKSFAASDRFLAELGTSSQRPGYVLLGDEIFLFERCRRGVLDTLMPDPGMRDFCLHTLDLAETSIFEILDRAQTPSLMAPFQIFFIRGLKNLYGRGSKRPEFAALDAYFRSPNPQALLLFVADHLRIPTDLRKMDLQDKERYDRIRETLGDSCSLIELARVDEADANRWILETAQSRAIKFDPDAARQLVDALGADMMLIASEFEKLLLYVSAPLTAPTHRPTNRVPQVSPLRPGVDGIEGVNGKEGSEGIEAPNLSPDTEKNSVLLSEVRSAQSKDLRLSSSEVTDTPETAAPIARNHVTLGDVETMVLAAKQRSLYELTDAISQKDRPRALALLHGLLNASDGGEDAAIGHLYMLARTFRQMLIISEKNVRDSRAIWQVLWQGFRMPPFAAEELIRQARRYKSRRELTRAIRLVARADLDLRSSPASKLLVLERLILDLATEPTATPYASPQFAMEL
ncbi:MAG TPA: DNA polymerase III subunit delta [Granulicella sp.]|nr:DNA polymerase III subunit delta [Granulicella sp.]